MSPIDVTPLPVQRVSPGLRIIAGSLAVSGAIYAPIALIFPFFWPGYFIWGVWIAIAIDSGRFNRPWFWLLIMVWNLAMSIWLLSVTDWTLHDKAMIYWLCRFHSVAACVLSGFAWAWLTHRSQEPTVRSE